MKDILIDHRIERNIEDRGIGQVLNRNLGANAAAEELVLTEYDWFPCVAGCLAVLHLFHFLIFCDTHLLTQSLFNLSILPFFCPSLILTYSPSPASRQIS